MAEENRDGANDPTVEKLRNRVETRSVAVLYALGALSWPGANRTPKQEQ